MKQADCELNNDFCYVFSKISLYFCGTTFCVKQRTPSVVYVRTDMPVPFHNMVNKVSY